MDELTFKNNFFECMQRYEAFWQGQPLDRSLILFDFIGQYRNLMYHGAGYDYQKYEEDIEL